MKPAAIIAAPRKRVDQHVLVGSISWRDDECSEFLCTGGHLRSDRHLGRGKEEDDGIKTSLTGKCALVLDESTSSLRREETVSTP